MLTLLVPMKNSSSLLPLQFGPLFSIRPLTWEDFQGSINDQMPWSAHIYWHIEFQIIDAQKKKVSANLIIGKRSWVREEKKCDHLLNHQQGHYLIGALCVLEFLRRIDYKKGQCHGLFEDLVQQTFDRTIKEYLEMERRYDNQTEHRLNYQVQEKWDQYICEKLEYYQKIYDRKKNKFVKWCDSPTKR